MTYEVTFTGRRIGAIGLSYRVYLRITADSPEDAVMRAYETHEHITGARAVSVSNPGNIHDGIIWEGRR